MIVCIEGLDASGKNTQAKRLAERLRTKVMSFPRYESPTGKMIKDHLQQKWTCNSSYGYMDKTLDPWVFQALMLCNRLEVVSEIRPSMKLGKDLVLDRYWPSGYVYGSNDGLPRDWLLSIHTQALPPADLYLLLDVSVEESFKRRPERRDRLETNRDYLNSIRRGYQTFWHVAAGTLSGVWTELDGHGTEDEVFERIVSNVAKVRASLS